MTNPKPSGAVYSDNIRTISVAVRFAPHFSSSGTQATFPALAARWRGVAPFCSEQEGVTG